MVIVFASVLIYSGCVYDYPVLSDKFSAIQKQTLTPRCSAASCHGDGTNGPYLVLLPDSSYTQLLYHIIQNTTKISQYPRLVVPFHPDSSYLVYKLTLPQNNDVDGAYMPNDNRGHLPQDQIDAIISWIKRGAPND